jgi:hypothetical protein
MESQLPGKLTLALLVLTVGSGVAAAWGATQSELAGAWRLQKTTGDLPDQAARAFDGENDGGDGMTIRIDWTDDAVTVRRLGRSPMILRALSLSAEPGPRPPGGGALNAHAEWRDGALVASGHITAKRGFIKRNVPFEEVWRAHESGRRLSVTTTLKTPLGVKRRTQLFERASED